MYFHSSIIIKKIKTDLDLSYYEINRFIEKAEVNLKSNEIKKYLEEKYLEEKKLKKNYYKDIIYSNYYVRRLELELEYGKYKFKPYTLEYFKKYINILKKKCINLIKIIDGLTNGTISPELLKELDISLDENGNILMSDVLRITNPFIYNFNELKEMVNKANNLETYLDFKISLDDVYRNGFSEVELYPSEKLQDENAEMFSKGKDGYIPLTEKQKILSKKKEDEYILAMCNIVKKM